MSDEKKRPQPETRPDEEVLLDLNFVPQWAKKDPGANHYQLSPKRGERRSDRPPRRGPRPPERQGRSPHAGRPERRAEPPRDARTQDRPPDRRPLRTPRVHLPLEIKFLPEQKTLGSIVRQIHHSKRAYPLIDLSHLFLADPKGHLVKLEVLPGTVGFTLYQGRRSKIIATDREVLLQQIVEEHLDRFFTKEELETEPPSGNFPMIAKIGSTLIAPPNHHSYADRLAEIHRTHYAGMPFDRFKEKVQTVRDDELVGQWKQEASRRMIYRLRQSPGGEEKEFTLVQAEDYLRTHLADTEIEEVSRAVLPSELARKIRDENLMQMIREAWQAESRFPRTLSFALRAAFRHLHLQAFKAGKNINFITAVKPDPIAPDAAVQTIREILEFLADHPGSTRRQLVEGLRPGVEKDSAEAHEILNPIRWLVERGHLIEFFNGTLSVPSRRKRGR
jgi:hypothetical protein